MSRHHRAQGAAPFSSPDLHDLLAECGRTATTVRAPMLTSRPILAALKRAGTRHIYADTADVAELKGAVIPSGEEIIAEVDGNTVHQPLVGRVLDRYLADPRFPTSMARIERGGWSRSAPGLEPLLYTMVCGWIGNDIGAQIAARRLWEGSFQLHMGVVTDARRARTLGRLLRRMVPSCLVKVPFTPHAPQCLLVARDLELERIPVNFTTTFSARQAVTAAVLADVTRTNIFLGRLNQGLAAARLGEHVALEAQRAIRRLRERLRVKTQLIVAGLPDWRTFDTLAGCDVFAAPCDALRAFLAQTELPPDGISNRLARSWEDELGVADAIRARLGPERIARLYRVEPELIDFLLDLRRTAEFQRTSDGEWLRRQFERAGFGDIFYAPDDTDWTQARRGTLPDLDSDLARRIPLDTHYTLLAHADFERHQDEIDATIADRLARSG